MFANKRGDAKQVLLLSEDPAVVARFEAFFERHAPVQTLVSGGRERFSLIQDGTLSTVVFDLKLSGAHGLATLRGLRTQYPGLPVLVLVEHESDPLAPAALEEGALDFLARDQLEDAWLSRTLYRAQEQYSLLSGLEAAEQGFAALVMNNADGMVMLDAEGTIRFANPAAEALFGRTKDELIGSSFGFPVVTGRSVEIDILRPGSGATVAEMQVTRTVWQGERLYLASLRDITLRKRAEQELARFNRELERRVSERTQEVRTLALSLTSAETAERNRIAQLLHDDLQQLLISAQFTLSGLRKRVGDEDKEAIEEAISTIKEAVKSCRLTAANYAIPVHSGDDLRGLLERLTEQFARQFNLHIALSGPDALSVESSSVRGFLVRVTRELLLNVVKHAGVLAAQLSFELRDNAIYLSVSDEGKGFDPTDFRDEGTGLGLTGLKKRILLLGGDIELHSNPGEGTVVSVSLPNTLPEV